RSPSKTTRPSAIAPRPGSQTVAHRTACTLSCCAWRAPARPPVAEPQASAADAKTTRPSREITVLRIERADLALVGQARVTSRPSRDVAGRRLRGDRWERGLRLARAPRALSRRRRAPRDLRDRRTLQLGQARADAFIDGA